jgi:AcrR family transcriptional regulator
MSPPRRLAPPAEASTREALLDAALDQLQTKGVLAGLNLREVADAVGVTPANIYYYFGTRQGLLRAALTREVQRLQVPLDETSGMSFVDRRARMFDAITTSSPLTLTALLALDGDPDYEPLPFIEATRAQYAEMAAAGRLPADLDIDATHLFAIAASIGVAIYADAASRQLGVPAEELRQRTRAVFEQMLEALVRAPAP